MIVLDIETSGLDVAEHGLLSVGAIDFLRPADTFYGECRLRRGEQVSPEALSVNGFSEKSTRDRAKFSTRDLLMLFDDWLQRRTVKVIAGLHIAAFDIPFLNTKAEQCRAPLHLHRRSVDLHSIAFAKMLSIKKIVPLTEGWSVMDTDVIHPFCGLPLEPHPHNALSGAKWEAESLSRLIYGKNLLAEFKRYPVPAYLMPVAKKKTLVQG